MQLWDVVEDELILALPSFSYHDTGECQQILAGLMPGKALRGGGPG